jgi:NMD protein affecting ribosome stability and mRNA decay
MERDKMAYKKPVLGLLCVVCGAPRSDTSIARCNKCYESRTPCEGKVSVIDAPCSRKSAKRIAGHWYCMTHYQAKRDELMVDALKQIAAHMSIFSEEELTGTIGYVIGISVDVLARLGEDVPFSSLL